MRNIVAFFVTLVACVACTTFEDFKRVGTYTYEGGNYDVYTAWRDDFMMGSDRVYVVVPKGVEPVPAAVVAVCEATDRSLTLCEQSFGKQIARLTSTKRDEGGMDY